MLELERWLLFAAIMLPACPPPTIWTVYPVHLSVVLTDFSREWYKRSLATPRDLGSGSLKSGGIFSVLRTGQSVRWLTTYMLEDRRSISVMTIYFFVSRYVLTGSGLAQHHDSNCRQIAKSDCLSVRMEKLGFHWTDFTKIGTLLFSENLSILFKFH